MQRTRRIGYLVERLEANINDASMAANDNDMADFEEARERANDQIAELIDLDLHWIAQGATTRLERLEARASRWHF